MVNREDVFKSLDLHGYSHDEVEREVVNFVFTNELPVLIIRGFSGPRRSVRNIRRSQNWFFVKNKKRTEQLGENK